ncbi:glycoside hydrolase family 11 protein [Jidongwangia harbinensis]|uniref:glycoside hydrolase family 11 protein n=1 Tax=Jidongwangia harbinensis TaxID=2878561 RepID=UPI001CD96119|nr:glycoside hydrolase family 11 protein [Jidongwangia harbinensis]MCA2211286.1 glycoside hydrolase family 11 protein [Jidongwangia harbinensis]
MDQTSGSSGRIRQIAGVACAAVLAVTAVAAAPRAHAAGPPERPVITTNQTGTHDGYFYAFWQDTGDAALTLRSDGRYSTRWSQVNNWFGGKGWATGGRRTFTYCGTLHSGGNAYLTLFGSTREPYVEFYIVENWGTYRPIGDSMGTLVSLGATYDIYRVRRMSPPGSPQYYTYFSVRQEKRSAGTINTGDHFDAWAAAGMPLGTTMGYMIMATEGYQSSGWSDVTVDSTAGRAPRCAPGPPSTP